MCETVKSVPLDWWLMSESSLKYCVIKTREELIDGVKSFHYWLPYFRMLDTEIALKNVNVTNFSSLFKTDFFFQFTCWILQKNEKNNKEKKQASDDVFISLWCNSLYFGGSFRGNGCHVCVQPLCSKLLKLGFVSNTRLWDSAEVLSPLFRKWVWDFRSEWIHMCTSPSFIIFYSLLTNDLTINKMFNHKQNLFNS